MAKVGFFTPICFETRFKTYPQRILEKVDNYFYLGGLKAHLVPFSKRHSTAALKEENQSLIITGLKVLSYFTIFLPSIPSLTKSENKSFAQICFYSAFFVPTMLLAKVALRYFLDNSTVLAHQPIDLSVIESLGLNLDEETTLDASKFESKHQNNIPTYPLTLRQAATDVINGINTALRANNKRLIASITDLRTVYLEPKAPWKEDGSNLYFYDQYCPSQETGKQQKWLHRILKALEGKEYIQFIYAEGIYGIRV